MLRHRRRPTLGWRSAHDGEKLIDQLLGERRLHGLGAEDQPEHDRCHDVVDDLAWLGQGRVIAARAAVGDERVGFGAAVAQAVGVAARRQGGRGLQQRGAARLRQVFDEFAGPGREIGAQVAGVGPRPLRIQPVGGGLVQ